MMMSRHLASFVFVFVAAALALACEKPVFTQDMTFAGVTVPAETLEEGRLAYIHYCRACHGDRGDGKGPAAFGLRPAPRDFRSGVYKFTSTKCGEIPPDEDLKRIIRRGLHGTPMLPWDLSDKELHSVVQYLKTFAPETWQKVNKRTGEQRRAGEPVAFVPDPWKPEQRAEAIARGRMLYHATTECNKCHPSYATREEIHGFRLANWEEQKKRMPEMPRPGNEFRWDPFPSDELKYSEDFGVAIPPPDFTMRELRSILLPEYAPDMKKDELEKTQYQDLFRVIAKGVCGTPMPGYIDVLTDAKDLWAVIHYVKSLIDLRGTSEALALKEKLQNQPAWEPPPMPEDSAATQPATQPAP